MKILGSGKVDDFKKVAVTDRVLDALDAKPGDSVIFYKKQGDNGVSIFRAEGSNLTHECDAPMTQHLREAPQKLRMFMFFGVITMALAMVMSAFGFFGKSNLIGFAGVVIFSVAAIACLVLGMNVARVMDAPGDNVSFVTVGGVFSKNRLAGISKLSSDGFVVSGDLYVNALFATNPAKVDVVFRFDDGEEIIGVCKCMKSVPGYNLYKVRMKSGELRTGKMVVSIKYLYEGKAIDVVAYYGVTVASDGTNSILLEEGPVDTRLTFDSSLNNTTFDEALFDPEDEDI